MVELAQLLESLDLSQYVETFAKSDIDAAALLDLEERHLKELGLSLGHRIRLMRPSPNCARPRAVCRRS